MNKLFRNILAASLVLTVLFSHNAYATAIYTYKETTPIATGVSLSKINEFYSDHNISYTVIEADFKNENLSFNLLKSNNGVDTFDTVSNLAKTDENVVAAVNADFFSSYKNGKGFSLGLELKDGKILQSPINPDTMATIFFGDDKINMSYIDFNISILAPNGETDNVRHLNKHTDYFGDILMYTSSFNGGMSPGASGEVVEVVVEKSKITEFRRNMPPVEIPKNGYIFAVSEGNNMFFSNNFEVGDEIKLNYSVSKDLLNSSCAVGGGSIIVSKGKALKTFTHTVSGYNPRTAIGTDKTGTKLYLVAVDGRQQTSRGMTMEELASLMENLGCYTAVNLDGGGSTNMIASSVFNSQLETVNSPTENRKVINAIGVTHNKETGKTTGIKIKSDKDIMFIGESANITASTHDEFLRPTGETVVLTSNEGTFNSSVFTAAKGGIATINARYGEKVATKKIYVIDRISGIKVENQISLKPEESKNLDIEVFDKKGNYTKITNISPFEITSSDETVVSVKNGKITGHKDGCAIITVKKDDAISYVSVTVGSEKFIYTEDFENPSGILNLYPSSSKGNFEKSDKFASSGKFSGKISFDFTDKSNESKAVYYMLFKSQHIYDFEEEISLNVYTENDFKHALKAQITDATGEIIRLDFDVPSEKEVWHTTCAKLPVDLKKPAKLDKIYVVYTDGEEKDEGEIYIDDLIFTSANDYKFEITSPNTYTDITDYKTSASVINVGAASSENTLFANAINRTFKETISKQKSHYIIENKKFDVYEDEIALYINVDSSNGGIRKTDKTQWNKIKDKIESSDKNNVFILSSTSIFVDDTYENQVIKDYFSSINKNIFVICGGDKNTYANFDGVLYFTLKNTDKTLLSKQRLDSYSYLQFSLGKDVTFKWKNLFE